jgi:hypothetical protein
MNRRDFIWTLPGLGASIWLTGCATDPVSLCEDLCCGHHSTARKFGITIEAVRLHLAGQVAASEPDKDIGCAGPHAFPLEAVEHFID